MGAPSDPGFRPPVLVSACLLGVPCRYNGRSSEEPGLRSELGGRPVLAVCPEELGGLGTPRPAAEIVGGDGEAVLDGRASVLTVEGGEDVTARFLEGARRAVAFAEAAGVEEAVLKERSPSCGCEQLRRRGELVGGAGVTAAALRRAGVRVRGTG